MVHACIMTWLEIPRPGLVGGPNWVGFASCCFFLLIIITMLSSLSSLVLYECTREPDLRS